MNVHERMPKSSSINVFLKHVQNEGYFNMHFSDIYMNYLFPILTRCKHTQQITKDILAHYNNGFDKGNLDVKE